MRKSPWSKEFRGCWLLDCSTLLWGHYTGRHVTGTCFRSWTPRTTRAWWPRLTSRCWSVSRTATAGGARVSGGSVSARCDTCSDTHVHPRETFLPSVSWTNISFMEFLQKMLLIRNVIPTIKTLEVLHIYRAISEEVHQMQPVIIIPSLYTQHSRCYIMCYPHPLLFISHIIICTVLYQLWCRGAPWLEATSSWLWFRCSNLQTTSLPLLPVVPRHQNLGTSSFFSVSDVVLLNTCLKLCLSCFSDHEWATQWMWWWCLVPRCPRFDTYSFF